MIFSLTLQKSGSAAGIPDYCITGKDLKNYLLLRQKKKLPVRELVIAYNDPRSHTKAATRISEIFLAVPFKDPCTI